jgi:hypothetical protein
VEKKEVKGIEKGAKKVECEEGEVKKWVRKVGGREQRKENVNKGRRRSG